MIGDDADMTDYSARLLKEIDDVFNDSMTASLEGEFTYACTCTVIITDVPLISGASEHDCNVHRLWHRCRQDPRGQW